MKATKLTMGTQNSIQITAAVAAGLTIYVGIGDCGNTHTPEAGWACDSIETAREIYRRIRHTGEMGNVYDLKKGVTIWSGFTGYAPAVMPREEA